MKVLFTDIDRTLLSHDYSIHLRVKAAISRAKLGNLMIIPVTARAPASLRPIAVALDMIGLCGCFNGAWIGRLDSNLMISGSRLPKILALQMMHEALRLGVEPVWYGETTQSVFALTDTVVKQLNNVTESAAVFRPSDHHDGPYKIMCIDRRDTPQLHILAQHFALSAEIAQSHPVLLEIGPKNVTKGTAVREIADLLGVSLDECAAAGDSYNDIPMLTAVGAAYTVANAVDEVKAVCSFVGGSCDEGGLADIIDDFLAR